LSGHRLAGPRPPSQPAANAGIMDAMGYHVRVERTDDGFVASNGRGAELRFGTGGDDASFTPVELLLVALGGCNIVTVEPLTAQRHHRLVRLAATVDAEKIKPNQLGPITMTYDVELPAGDADAARVFHDVALRVHEKACTVSTALETVSEVDLILPG
jgi:putative redox protein